MFARALLVSLAVTLCGAFAPAQRAQAARSKVVVAASKIHRARAPLAAPERAGAGSLVESFKFTKHFNRFTFKTFYKLIEAAGLEEMLSTGEYTIFAPTDAAFIELGDEGVAELMKDTAKLAEIIKFHVMPGIVEGDFIRGTAKSLTTIQGSDLVVDSDGKIAYVDQAKCLTFDVKADNGVFHIIDWVNTPKAN